MCFLVFPRKRPDFLVFFSFFCPPKIESFEIKQTTLWIQTPQRPGVILRTYIHTPSHPCKKQTGSNSPQTKNGAAFHLGNGAAPFPTTKTAMHELAEPRKERHRNDSSEFFSLVHRFFFGGGAVVCNGWGCGFFLLLLLLLLLFFLLFPFLFFGGG